MTTNETTTTQTKADKEKKGDQPPPGKVEAKRQEQSGKTFKQHGTEKHG